jgi:hypothetical protein
MMHKSALSLETDSPSADLCLLFPPYALSKMYKNAAHVRAYTYIRVWGNSRAGINALGGAMVERASCELFLALIRRLDLVLECSFAERSLIKKMRFFTLFSEIGAAFYSVRSAYLT